MSLTSSDHLFTVTRKQPELVVPLVPTPRELKRLSDIDDQQSHRVQFPFVFFYRKESQITDPVRVVKEGLGRALILYYPLTGRLKEDLDGKLFVDCNAEGVLFIEANANIRLDELGNRILSPSSFLDDVLYNVPGSDGIVGCPLLLIQVTRLLCGGFILAIRMNHAITDGFGLSQFLKMVAQMGRGSGEVILVPPVWQRELLNARDPPRITFEHHEYEDTTLLNHPATNKIDSDDMTQRFFFLTPEFMKRLRKKLPMHLVKNCSSFELLAACFWKCRTRALNIDDDEFVYISFAVSVRGRLAELHPGFYGSASAYPSVVSMAKFLAQNPLSHAVELVKKAKSKMSEEYIRSVADLMATRGRPPFKTRNNIVISDARMVGFGEVDFGSGPPSYVGPAIVTPTITIVSKYKNDELGREGIIVPICLPIAAMRRFEMEMKKMVWEPHSTKFNDMSVTKIMSML